MCARVSVCVCLCVCDFVRAWRGGGTDQGQSGKRGDLGSLLTSLVAVFRVEVPCTNVFVYKYTYCMCARVRVRVCVCVCVCVVCV
jgi:hypothetical protein